MTEEQQGGTAPQEEALPSTDEAASEQRVATVVVADEPANETAAVAAAEPSEDTDQQEVAAEGAPAVAGGAAPEPPEEVVSGVPEAEEAGPAASAEAEPAEVEAVEAVVEGEPAEAEPVEAVVEAVVEGEPAEAEPAGADFEAEPTPAPDETVRREPRGPEPATMEELLAEQDADIRSFKHGDVVEGTVVRIDKDEILVDIGAKSEGVVSNRELFGRNTETQPQLTIGDTVLVYVLQPESPEGHVVLSLRRAGLERKWRSMQEQFEAGLIIEAPVIDHNKGGLIVDCGIRGFVPISQIVDFPRRPQNDQPRDAAQEIAEKLQPYVGRKLRLKILEVNRKANRLILSEKVALYEERREKRDELFSSLQVGQRVKGSVRSIAPFGVFIDLGGIDGLVHKSELSWNKVNNPEAGYRVGEEVEAEVIDINHERGRISLSIRRLQPDPWHSTVADFKVGDVIDGTVTKLVNFGAFVRVRDGLEGLIHISELSHQRVAHPGDVVHEGQQLKLKIISLDSERHRLGLSLKQAEEPPARPAPEPGQPRPERRPRGGERERGYSMADAVQEPEGGIDNTLAAAFAQVRRQLAAAEAEDVEPPAGSDMAGEVAVSMEPQAEAALEAEAAVEAESVEVEPEPGAAAEAVEAEADEAAVEAEGAAAVEVEAAGAAAGEAEPEEAQAEPGVTAEAEEAQAEPGVTAEAVEAEPVTTEEVPPVQHEPDTGLLEEPTSVGPAGEAEEDRAPDEAATASEGGPTDEAETGG